MTISIVGLGKLGACLAACFAHRDFSVIGVDVNPWTVAQINDGLPPVYEPGLAEMIAANRIRIRATQDYIEAIESSDVTFIVVPTPSDERGAFSLRYVQAAANAIGQALAGKQRYHLVVLVSTVLPGSTEYGVLPILEHSSGKRCGEDFGLCYDPEFVALGTVIRDMLRPHMVIIGEHDAHAGTLLEEVYRRFVENEPKIWRMNIINAEIAKIALNAYVTIKISYANTLSEMCERLPGADADIVAQAIGSDPRVGHKALKGGLGFGGPCFPRDTKSFAFLLRSLGVEPLQIEAADKVNRMIVPRVLSSIRCHLSNPGDTTVAVLGLAYKPGTVVVEQSQGLEIAQVLADNGCQVIVYDPLAAEEARRVLDARVRYASTIQECLEEASIAVFANPCPEFQSLKPSDFVRLPNLRVVIDCWRILRGCLDTNCHIRYVPLGVGGDCADADALRQWWQNEGSTY